MGWGDIAQIGGAIAGGIFGGKAADDQSDALKEGIKFQKQAAKQARTDYAPYVQQGAGANAYLGQTMGANPAALTPGQQLYHDDLMTNMNRSLNAGPLAGAGRSTAGILKKVSDNFMANAYDANRQRSDQAASALSGQGFNATQGGANAQLGQASGIATNTALLGANRANADTGYGQMSGDIISAIGSLMAARDARKDPTAAATTGTI